MPVTDPLLLKKLFIDQNRLEKDLEFTKCVIERMKERIFGTSENFVPKREVESFVRMCHKNVYGREIGLREEPKFYGDLDRLRVLYGVPASKHEELTPEFRTSNPDGFKLNPLFFSWDGRPIIIAESYVRLNVIAKTILNDALSKYGVSAVSIEEFWRTALDAMSRLASNEKLPEKWRKLITSLVTKLEKRSNLLLKQFVLPISLLSGNTLISYEDGRIVLTEKLKQLIQPEGVEARPTLAPSQLLSVVLEAYHEAIREVIGIDVVPRESGIQLELDTLAEKLAAKLNVGVDRAIEYLREAARVCPQGVIIESFDVLRVKRKPQVYIIPALVEVCKSG